MPFKGQLTRAILDILRVAGAVDAKAIKTRLVARRELNPNGTTLAKATQKGIGTAGRNLTEGLVASK
jgi:hypothetical protein